MGQRMDFIQFNVPMANRMQQIDGSVIIWTGIVNISIIGSIKVNEGIKMNSANYRNSMDKIFIVF